MTPRTGIRGVIGAGRTGLEPAASGVTGRFPASVAVRLLPSSPTNATILDVCRPHKRTRTEGRGRPMGTIQGTTRRGGEMAKKKAKKKRRRVRSLHPGVKLKKRVLPGGGVSWRAHFM